MTAYGSTESKASTAGPAKENDTEKTPLVKIYNLEADNPNTTNANNRIEELHFERKLWSRLIFQWFTPILERGNTKRKLDQEDLELVPLPEDCTTDYVADVFDKCWRDELARNEKNPSLIRALYSAYGRDYMRAGGLKLIHDLCVFVGPQVLHGIVVFLADPDAPVWHGLGLTLLVTVSQLFMSICLRHYFFKCYSTGLRIRTAVVMAVYRKALNLAASERQKRTLGEIVNLMSIDAERLQELVNYLHSLWSGPLQISLALLFLWRQLGPSCLGGVAVVLIMIPVTRIVAQWMGYMQESLMKKRDARVELTGEVLGGMKVIKFQAWEEPYMDRILALRSTEMKQLFVYYVCNCLSELLWTFTPPMVALATFSIYILTGNTLDVATALTALALLEILRFPLYVFPSVVNEAVEAYISIKRIRSFLMCDEHKSIGPGELNDIGLQMDNVSASYDTKRPKIDLATATEQAKALADREWELTLLKSQLEDAERKIRELSSQLDTKVSPDGQEEYDHSTSLLCLSRINFSCGPGEIVAIVGGVGCGKSSFVNAMLGEVRILSGSTAVNGSLAYFCQTPFIMNGTVRENILFGHVDEAVDEDLYQRALLCCALRHDLELLSYGDETEIGEKGVTLSGGQKARVALARAVYHQADITLIDDALSAVDAHVAKQLFEECIVGELMKPREDGRKRSVVFVTNALQYLSHPMVNRICVMREGRIAEEGQYADLASRPDSVFSRFLSVLQETGVSGALTEGCAVPVETGVDVGEKKEGTSKESPSDDAVVATKSAEVGTSKRLMTEETRQTGEVDRKMYVAWTEAAGGVWLVPLSILACLAIVEAVSVVSNWWLTYWSQHGTSSNQEYFLGIYALINAFVVIGDFLRSLLMAVFGLRAARKLFSDLVAAVLQAPMGFFDSTPIGRLMNRFGKDMYTIDEELTNSLIEYLITLFYVGSTICVITWVNPFFTICLVPMVIFYVNEQKFFTLTYRELKRVDSVNRSPIFALLGESVDGVSVIRAFSAQQTLTERVKSMLDKQQHAYYLTCAAQSWLAIRLELIGTLIITFTTLGGVLEKVFVGADEHSAGLAGLAVSYALSVTQSLNWTVRKASDLEANMVAVERVKEYSAIEHEGERTTSTDSLLPAGWPLKGEITFKESKLRYRKELPLVLKGLNLTIPGGSKVGVVGRTGAGKSTLMVALMRIVELSEGSILIDGQDTKKVGLAKLRRNLAVIPQDPVLFSGTVRTNLDPFNEFDEQQLFGALERVGLKASKGSSHSFSSAAQIESLDDVVLEGGQNFSVGERQLIVFARSLLRGAKVVIMDEATAAVDAETDASIQKVMRNEFANATCITVAHRLNTIMDSDYILVMDDGRAAEFGTPSALLQKGGLFRDLVGAASQDG